MKKWLPGRARLAPTLVAAGLAATVATAGVVLASDHQDTPLVELSPRYDVNDVYAFPASTPGRVVLVLSTSSPLTPAQTPSFTFGTRDKELYQIKIDNNGDAMEDLVFQISFTGGPGQQIAKFLGPVKPNEIGTANTLVAKGPGRTAALNTVVMEDGMKFFAGPRDDPFFIDLEQFFRIIPDRRPSTGPLSQIPSTPSASSFRDDRAVDFVRGFNDMAIVIEAPLSLLVADPKNPTKFGVWGTTSRARGT